VRRHNGTKIAFLNVKPYVGGNAYGLRFSKDF